jgi:D-3-phosphoglycerate dehydrogenase
MVDLDICKTMGVVVFSARFDQQYPIAEYVICCMILLARQIADKSRQMHLTNWNKSADNSVEVRGKTLGIVGYGKVGAQLSVLAEALGMEVLFYDTLSMMAIGRAKAVSFQELLAKSDFVSIHVSNSSTNDGLFSSKELLSMKRGSFLINTSFPQAVLVYLYRSINQNC